MLLLEHEAKKLATKFGVPVPRGILCREIEGAVDAADNIGYPVFLKAQVPVKERLRLGGVLLAESRDEVSKQAARLLGTHIASHLCNQILVEEKMNIQTELYLAFTYDLFQQKAVFMLSTTGGAGIEARAGEVSSFEIALEPRNDPRILGLQDSGIFSRVPIPEAELLEITRKVAMIFREFHAELVEINPLALTSNGRSVALDVRVSVDDDALFSKPELREEVKKFLQEDRLSQLVRGQNFVELEGEIGVIGNGAGLVLATMDLVRYFQGSPANFLDLGGGSDAQSVREALKMLSGLKRLRCIVINVLGGITRCDEIALGLVESLRTLKLPKLYVRLVGTNEREAQRILNENGVPFFTNMETLVKTAVSG